MFYHKKKIFAVNIMLLMDSRLKLQPSIRPKEPDPSTSESVPFFDSSVASESARTSKHRPELKQRLLLGLDFLASKSWVKVVHFDWLQESMSHNVPPVQLAWSISNISGAPASFSSIDLNVTFSASLNSTRWISKNLVKLEVWKTTSWLLSSEFLVLIIASVMEI